MARRLKNGEAVAAEAHENVTILFCDIVGFTGMSSSVGPFLCGPRSVTQFASFPLSPCLDGSKRFHSVCPATFQYLSINMDHYCNLSISICSSLFSLPPPPPLFSLHCPSYPPSLSLLPPSLETVATTPA